MKRVILTAIACCAVASLTYAQDTGIKKTNPQASVLSISLPVINVSLKAGEGKDRVENFCGICHSLDYITTQPGLTEAQWKGIVNKMVKVYGAPIGEDDAAAITKYLVSHYGSAK